MHVPSITLGFVGAYLLSCVAFGLLLYLDGRLAKKRQDKARSVSITGTASLTAEDTVEVLVWSEDLTAQDEALDQLLADVSIQCIERPVDVRKN